MIIKKPIIKLSAKETRLGVEAKKKSAKGREPYKYTYQIKKDGKWADVGRITYGKSLKKNRRKKSNHNPKWIND